MSYLVILLVLIGFAGTMLATEFTQNSYAITLGMSSEQILENHQLIILGYVDSVEISSGQTKYTISVLDYIKYPDKFEEKETIKVVGCAEGQIGGCITFDKGQNVLFPLNEKNGIFHISEVSFVAPNPDCTTNDLFALNDAKYGLETSQNNQTKQFFTGQPIDITFYAYNKKLDDSSYKVTVEFFRANNNTVFSKTFEGKFEECIPNVKLETAFIPTDMGRYGKRYTASYGGGELLWGFPIIEKGATPLKQFKSSISIDKIQCKDNLVLIQKYDGSPACVTEQTKIKLIERGWIKMDDSQIRIPVSVPVPTDPLDITINGSHTPPIIPIKAGEIKEIDILLEPKVPIVSSTVNIKSYFGSAGECIDINIDSYCPGRGIDMVLSDTSITSQKEITLTISIPSNMTSGTYAYLIETKTLFESSDYNELRTVGKSIRFDLKVE